MQRILVLGGGFAGLWSAVSAARRLDELGVGEDAVEITLVNRTPYHSIRVRNYEADLAPTIVPLAEVLDPIGVKHLEAEVTEIDCKARSVVCSIGGAARSLPYDRLVFALGSRLNRPHIPGLAQHAFDVDTYEDGSRLNAHIAGLSLDPPSPGRFTVLIVGGGLTGIEVATEMPEKLRAAIAKAPDAAAKATPRVILADRNPWIGSDMGESARPLIAEALRALGIETRVGVSLASVTAGYAELTNGERIAASTVVWCVGLGAHPLAAQFPVERDHFGRVPVDEFLKIKGMPAEFAAGDVAWMAMDGPHLSVMSCQHGRPMGRFAGYNVVSDLLGRPMLPLRIGWYTTILDLGNWGAVYTEGWDRHVVTKGEAAKRTKRMINRERIYPPRAGGRRAILDAAAPVVQAPPTVFREAAA